MSDDRRKIVLAGSGYLGACIVRLAGDYKSILEYSRTHKTSSNIEHIHKDFDEHLDIDFYKQIQSNGALDINMIHGIINYIIDQIKNFGSLEDEPWNEIWKTQIVVKINRGEPLNILLPDFFKEAMHRIDKIEMEINAFKQSDLYKYFSEKRKTRE